MKYAFITALALSSFLAMNLNAQAEPGKQEIPDLEGLTNLSDKAPQEKPKAAPAMKTETPVAMRVKAAEMKRKNQKSKQEIFEALDKMKEKGNGLGKPVN
jgi:hypothetical protein